MYGILLESIVTFIKKTYGEEKWELVRKTARVDQENFSAHQVYAETLIPRIVDACHAHLGQPKEDILISFGKTYVEFISHYGYDKILKVVGRNFRDFLNGLDNIHEYLRFSYPKLKPPSFFCEQESRTGLILHYRSRRRYDGYTQYVMGLLKAVGRAFYKQDIMVSILKQETTGNMVHVTFQLNFDNSAYQAKTVTENPTNLPLRMDVFYDLFPFHILFDREMIIRSIGKSLRATVDDITGYDATQVFSLKKPLIDFSWDAIAGRTNTMFELATIDPIRGKEDGDDEAYTWTDDKGKKRSSVVTQDEDNGTFLRLKGQMLFVKEWESMLFLGTAVLQDLDVLSQTGLYLNDLSMHDNSRDLVLAGAQQGVEMKLILKQEQTRTKSLDDALRKLENERHRSKELMYKLLPKPIADLVLAKNENRIGDLLIPDTVELAPLATILVCTLQHSGDGKTDGAENSTMENLRRTVAMQKHIDLAIERFGFYKIETTQESFLAVSGIPVPNEATEDNACFLAKKLARSAHSITGMRFEAAIHTGPTVYSVVGCRFPRLCILGPTVQTAQDLLKLPKIQLDGELCSILLTESTKSRLARDHTHKFQAGPSVPLRGSQNGQEPLKTFLLQVS
ncbi:Soluble guanylate cyclase 88E [Hypsibius exemplaris]|uniref:guanylate cyclase n=1 Tax=Hypsibius exemplaris TaxID=2072580 RepID=A0A1W0XDN7_HYPEX|nr:Soluble guanylate cyclase 88E [Hypsibius exemplaris]